MPDIAALVQEANDAKRTVGYELIIQGGFLRSGKYIGEVKNPLCGLLGRMRDALRKCEAARVKAAKEAYRSQEAEAQMVEQLNTERERAAQAEKERDFLLLRRKSHLLHGGYSWVGISSDALVSATITGEAPGLEEYPRDAGDLVRCYRTYEQLPKHLKESSMAAYVMGKYKEHVGAWVVEEAEKVLAADREQLGIQTSSE